MAKNQSKDMTVGNPFQIILFFAIPVLIGNVFQQLYSMVDTIIVGQSLGTEALAAVGSTGSLNFLVNGFSTGIAGGFAVLPAQFFGAKDEKRLKKSVGQAILLCLFFTVSSHSTFSYIYQTGACAYEDAGEHHWYGGCVYQDDFLGNMRDNTL